MKLAWFSVILSSIAVIFALVNFLVCLGIIG